MKLVLLSILALSFSSVFAQRTYTYEKCVADDAEFTITKDAIKQGYSVITSLSKNKTYANLEVTLKSESQIWEETTTYEEGELVAGDGSKSDWAGFFSAKKEAKAKALSNAVKGIGMSTAHKLVKKNAFSNKPRSWNAFINVLANFEKQHKAKSLVSNVTRYAYANKISLGYLVASQGEMKTTKRLKERFRDSQRVQLEINLNKVLLSGESEKITIESGFCDDKDTVNVYANDRYYALRVYTSYRGVRIEGTRKRVSFPSSSFSYIPTQENGILVLKNLKLNYNESIVLDDLKQNNGSVELSGTVECLSEKQGSFWEGRSKEDKAKDKASRKVISFFKLSDTQNGSYNTNIATGCDFKAIVKLSASVKNSSYYNSNSVSSRKEIQIR